MMVCLLFVHVQAEKGDLLHTNLGGYGGPTAPAPTTSTGAPRPAALPTTIKLKVVTDKKVGWAGRGRGGWGKRAECEVHSAETSAACVVWSCLSSRSAVLQQLKPAETRLSGRMARTAACPQFRSRASPASHGLAIFAAACLQRRREGSG
jgi:hypothetical protein